MEYLFGQVPKHQTGDFVKRTEEFFVPEICVLNVRCCTHASSILGTLHIHVRFLHTVCARYTFRVRRFSCMRGRSSTCITKFPDWPKQLTACRQCNPSHIKHNSGGVNCTYYYFILWACKLIIHLTFWSAGQMLWPFTYSNMVSDSEIKVKIVHWYLVTCICYYSLKIQVYVMYIYGHIYICIWTYIFLSLLT